MSVDQEGSRAGSGPALGGVGPAPWNPGERACALVLFLIALPVIAALALLVRLVDGAPSFHRGTRLGRGRRPFRMLKLRTLRIGADAITGAELLGNREELTIPMGRFLRDTRLDELPQLLNIVRGDMSFVGPRPERPEVFASKCADIPGYQRRFAVRPGLIGISQLFTPHGTPKRYRTLIDNGVLRRGSRSTRRLRIVLYTVWAVLQEVLRRASRQARLLRAALTGRYREKRRLRRFAPEGALVQLYGREGPLGDRPARLIDLNAESLLVECPFEPGHERATQLLLAIPVSGRNQPARRLARCTGRIAERRAAAGRSRLVIHYKPCSPRSEYMIHQYFLRGSLARPSRRHRRVTWSEGFSLVEPSALPAPRPPAPRHAHEPVARVEPAPALPREESLAAQGRSS